MKFETLSSRMAMISFISFDENQGLACFLPRPPAILTTCLIGGRVCSVPNIRSRLISRVPARAAPLRAVGKTEASHLTF